MMVAGYGQAELLEVDMEPIMLVGDKLERIGSHIKFGMVRLVITLISVISVRTKLVLIQNIFLRERLRIIWLI